jgi:hypothetical protein
MQSEPSATPQQPFGSSAPLATENTTQHGLHDHDASTLEDSPRGVDTGTSDVSEDGTAEQVSADARFAAALQNEGAEPTKTAERLSHASTPSPPPSTPAGYHRITEYEQASTPPMKRREGPGFEVLKKQRSPGDKRSPIQELPNGE